MSYYKKTIGKFGEERANKHLEYAGHRILCRNFSCKCGEIDIISEKDGYVIFTEVKTRSDNRFSTPAEAVTAEKRKHIIKSAQYYLKLNGVENSDCRFDVIEIMANKDFSVFVNADFSEYDYCGTGLDGEFYMLRHIKNAFGQGGM